MSGDNWATSPSILCIVLHCCFAQDSNEGFRKAGFLSFWAYHPLFGFKPKSQKLYFISGNPKCPGYPSIFNKSRRYLLFWALLRSKFDPIWNSSPGCLKQQWWRTSRETGANSRNSSVDLGGRAGLAGAGGGGGVEAHVLHQPAVVHPAGGVHRQAASRAQYLSLCWPSSDGHI